MIKRALLCGFSLMGAVACVSLTPAGARVRLLPESDVAMVASCQSLGQVRVSSPDALRNASAELSGDTALYSVRDAGGNFYLRGQVYRCATAAAQEAPVARLAPSPVENPASEEYRRKSEVCRHKGGEWQGGLCVIRID